MPAKLWADFERLTATDLNTYLAQQVTAVFADAAARDLAIPAPVVGQGAYLTGLGVLTRYNGTAWKYEAWTGGLPGAALESVGTQSIAAGAITKATILTAVERDTHGYALGSSELTIPALLGGRYLLTAQIEFAALTGSTPRYGIIVKTGNIRLAFVRWLQDSAGQAEITVSNEANLAAGDKVWLEVGNGAGSAVNILTTADYANKLSIHRIGD